MSRTSWTVLGASMAILLQIPGQLVVGTGGLLVGLATAGRLDPGALRFLGGRRFWVLSGVIAALAGLLLGRDPEVIAGVSMSLEGFAAGLLMVIRSAAFLVAVALLARHLPRERVLLVSSRLGLAPLGPAVTTAVELLPALQDQWRHAASDWRPQGLFQAAARIVGEAARVAEGPAPVVVFAVTGAPGSGKTRLLEQLVSAARERSFRVSGVLQPRHPQAGSRDSYDLVDLSTGAAMRVADFDETGPVFQHESFAAVAPSVRAPAELTVVDELGHLEARGGGHWLALLERRAHPGVIVVSVARLRTEVLLERLGLAVGGLLDLDAPDADPERFTARLLDEVATRAQRTRRPCAASEASPDAE